MQQAQNPWEMDLTQEDSAPWEMDFEPPRPEPSSILRRAGDVGISALKGAIGLPESFVGMADLVSNGQVGKAVEDAGVRFKDAKSYLDQFYSPEQQRANSEVQDADGFLPTVGAMVRNPSTIVNAAVESAPSVLGGWGVSRGLMGAAPKISSTLAGAIGEGATAAGQNAEQVRQESTDGLLTPEQSGILAASGALTGAIGYGAGRLANRLGVGDIDTLGLQRNATAEVAQKAAEKGLFRRIGEGALTEGVLEELPQSYQEQVAQNLAQDKPWDEGAAKAAAQGMMAGALMGAGAGPFHGGQQEAPPQQETPPPQIERTPDETGYNQDETTALQPIDAPVTKSEAMGLAPTPGPSLTNAAITAVDTGAHDIELAQQAAQAQADMDQQQDEKSAKDDASGQDNQLPFQMEDGEAGQATNTAPSQAAAQPPVNATEDVFPPVQQEDQQSAGGAFANWTDEQLVNQFRGSGSRDIRNILATELQRRREQAAQAAPQVQDEAVQQPTEEQAALPPSATPTPDQAAQPQPEVVPNAYDSLPMEQKAEVLQRVPRLVADSGGLNVIGKSMLNRPLDQMPPAVQQAVEQVLTPQPQEDDQTTQAIAPEAQQPPQQQVEPTYPAQRTTLAAIQQQASAGPAYNAQGIDAMLPAKTPLQAAIERIRNEKAAEKNKPVAQQVEQQAEGSDVSQAQQEVPPPKVDQPGTNQQALDRIAAGKAWFGNELKARNWVQKNGLAGTHDVRMTKPGRFEVVPKNGESEQTSPSNESTGDKKQVNKQVVEHSGLKISQQSVKIGDTVQSRWVVQSPENAEREAKGERQIGGDAIVDSREEAVKTAERETARYAEEKARKAEFDRQEQEAKKQAEAKKEANRNKSLLERRADAILDKPTNLPPQAGLGTGTRRESMDKAVSQGRFIEQATAFDSAAKKKDTAAVDLAKAKGYILGLSNENIPVVKAALEAQARLKENKYEKPEYRVYSGSDRNGSFYEISKTEYDYAQSLKTAEQKAPATTASDATENVADGKHENVTATDARKADDGTNGQKSISKKEQARIQRETEAQVYRDLLANADMVGKSMLNRPLDQMPPAVQQAVEQVLTPQPQEDDQTTQAIAPEAQQPPQQQVEPTYPAQRTTLAAIQQQASAGPAYNAQGIDAMLPAKTPLQAAIERIRNEKAAEKNKPVAQPAAQSKPKTLKESIEKHHADIREKSLENIQNNADTGTTESNNAGTLQTKPVSERDSRETQADATARNRDSESVGSGVAGNSAGTAGVWGVPASTNQPGEAGARGTEQSGQQPSSPARDSAGVRTEPVPTGSNEQFVIDGEDIGKGGLTKKYRDNIAAIKILKALDAEGRVATPDERKQLAKYVGWGALKGPFDPENKQWSKQHAELKELLTEAEFKAARRSTLDAHYTSPIAVGAMYDAMGRLGFTGGRVLEPSVGSGNFFGLMPRELRNASQLHGVELDALTSKLVSALYPEAKIAKSTGFEDFEIPSEFFDAVIGNPPFGNQPLVDKERSAYSGFSIHNYFLSKGIDKLRPGGVMTVVVSHNFLDAKDDRARKWIAERANLLGAVRLPNTAFKENAGTEVVTDILVFQKKPTAEYSNGLANEAAPWLKVVDQKNINPKTGEAVTHKVNEFFANRTGDVLGTPTAAGSMYGGNEYTIEPTGDLKQQLAGWVKALPSNVFTPIDRTSDNKVTDMAVPDGVKVGSYYIDDGRIMQRGEDVMGDKTATVWTPPNEKAAARMRGMIALRDTLRQQMRLERSADATTDEIEKNRTLLNRQYDEFLKKYGHINNQTNRRIFLDDTESQLIQALEFDYDKGISKEVAEREEIEPRDASAVKADIFNRRVAFPPQDFLTVESAKDALLASLNYRGKIDTAYMEEVFHKPAAEIVQDLGDVVFYDPQHGLVTADEYLSGDVKTKLTEAQAAAKDNPDYKRNVAALEKIIPADKKPSEISASIGASFVPAEMYRQFMKHISGGDATVVQIKATGQWLVDYKGQADTALNTGKFGTKDLSAQELFQLSMMGRGAVVKKIIKNPDGSTTTLLLEKETEAAREKQNAIKAEWQKWLWQDPERSDKIASIYNEKMNRIVDRKYDGSHMTFPGMNPAIIMLEHQKNGVWRGLQSRQVLYDHVVGAGKTFQMATLAMEMRRLGIARKPMFVVPNHLTLQWRSEFTRLYPGANILAATPEDFSKSNRERMFSKIITGDWDAVVIGHSSLKKIGLPEETEKAVLQEQIDEISEAVEEMKRGRGDRNIIRDMEKIRSNLEAKMKDKLAAIGKRDKVVTFDELGIDAMFLDEMHEFKNLTYNSTMDRNPGMGNPAGSAKAFDLFVKTRWLFDTFGSKVPYVTATGTPVSNSLVEMFNMQRYMQYPTLKAHGLHVFDSWAKQFGSVDNVYEVAPSGSGYRQSTRFAKFTNLPALMGLYNSFADTVTLDDLKAQEEARGKRFPVPKVTGGKPTIVVAKRSPMVTEFMGVPRAEIGADGQVKFDVDLTEPISIEQGKQSGKWVAKSGSAVVGTFDTEQDAKLKLVEQALSPVVSVDKESILGRFANLRQLTKDTKGKVNALSLTGEANKAGLDYRLIDPSAPDFAGSKINLAVNHIVRLHKQWDADNGTQLVFCDMSIPTSARSSYSTKARRLYVLDDAGAVTMKRGTMHTVAGHEYLPFFVVQRGQKDAKRFDVFDAASGIKVKSDLLTKADAIEVAGGFITDDKKRQSWIDAAHAREISQDQIDAYNDENEVETDGIESFTREDIAGISGSAKFSVYDDIKAKLVAKGIPEREIAFIHDYSTPTAKDKLFKAVNAGDVRVLLGSTPKMGAGTNVQKRLVALHHIDAPWRPSDLEQREGRIIRRNNDLYERDPEGFEVFIGRYATEQTYDTRRWQILEHKARGIEQLRNYDGSLNEIDDIEGEAANSADMKAAASGDPMIMQETSLRNEVRRLEQLQAAHADGVLSLTRKARSEQEYADKYGPRLIGDVKGLLATVKKNPLDAEGWAPVTVNGKVLTVKEKALEELARVASVVRAGMEEEARVQYRGLEFVFNRQFGTILYAETPTGTLATWSTSDPFSTSGFVQRLKNYVDRLPAILEDTQARVEKAANDAKALMEESRQPFAQATDLERAREDHKKVQRALMAKGPVVPDEQKALVAAGIAEQKAKLEKLGYGEALREFFGAQEPTVFRATGLAGIWSQPVSHESVKGTVAVILKRIPNAPHVEVYRTPAEAGISISDPMPKGGTLPDGRIVIFSDANTGTLDVMRTVFHELFHRGLKSYFQSNADYTNFMLDLSANHSIVRVGALNWRNSIDGQEKWKEFEAKGPMTGDRLANYEALAVEESLAKLAETLRAGSPLQVRIWTRGIANLLESIARFFKIDALADWIHGLNNTVVDDFVNQMIARSGNQPVHGTTSLLLRSGATTFTATANKVASTLSSFSTHPGTVSGWWKTVGSMYGLAQKNPEFKPVFDAGQRFLNDVSYYATEAANLAPTLLPKLKSIRDMFKAAIPHSDNKPLADALFQGTLSWKRDAAGKLEKTDNIDDAGVVFTAAELKSTFGMNDRQVGLYHEARAAIDNSLDNTAKAAMVQLGGKQLAHMREMVMAAPSASDAANLLAQEIESMTDEDPDMAGALDKAASDIKAVADKITKLKDNGYAPLSRFGRYTVDVVANGKREYFGLFESKRDANLMAEKMRSLHSGATVEQGTLSQKEFELFQGITPETAELFGDMLGVDQTEAFQEYLRLVKNNRSAMKRLIHRKGVAGYNEDVGRVLSAFIASNSRKGSSDLNLGDMTLAVSSIPKNQGELKDIAISLQKYLTNPQEEAPAMRGMLFAQYIGGSVASAMVNLTQPMQVSMPYLSQFGGAKKATGALWGAYRDMANKGYKYPPALESALRVAEEQGIIAPQEIHQLQAQARGAATLRSGDGTPIGEAIAMGRNHFTRLMLGWGKLFGLAEQVNRRATFVAAYRLAQQQGIANPAAFAAKAVHETQFVNNKGNRMHFGRGPIGSVAMTFKSYGLNYLELLHRMATQNGTEGKQAAALMLGMLVLMAGAGGLPFEDDLMDVVDALAQRLGYNFSSKKAKQQFLEETFGKAAADFIDKGITGLPGMPIDVSLRMGMGNMIPGTGLLLQKKDHTRDLLELGGPALDLGKRLFDAAGSLADGKVGSAITTAMPKAAGNWVQGAGMWNKGYYTDAKGNKVMDTTKGEAVAKFFGFQPESVASDSEATGLVQRMKDVRAINAEKFADMWARGIYEKDQQQVQEARDAIKAWNDKNPDTRIMPNIPAILRRVREMRKTRDQRMIDSSPKAMRAGIRRELAEARS